VSFRKKDDQGHRALFHRFESGGIISKYWSLRIYRVVEGDDFASTFPVSDGKGETLQKEQEKIAELYSSIGRAHAIKRHDNFSFVLGWKRCRAIIFWCPVICKVPRFAVLRHSLSFCLSLLCRVPVV